MKRYALYHIEEELYLTDESEVGYDLDNDLYLFTEGELEFIFSPTPEIDIEIIKISDGTEYNKSDFELIEFRLSEMKRINFEDYNIEN